MPVSSAPRQGIRKTCNDDRVHPRDLATTSVATSTSEKCLIFLEDLTIVSILFNVEIFPPPISSTFRAPRHPLPALKRRATQAGLVCPPKVPPKPPEGHLMHARLTRSAPAAVLAAILACVFVTSGFVKAGAADKADDGNGVLSVLPPHSTLTGRRATAQLVATARGADGAVQDQTRSVEWASSNPSVASVTPKGRVIPKGNGTVTIVAHKGSLEASTTVTVQAMEKAAPVSFRQDVIPSFSQAGCNTGACHGTPTGKGGFHMRGYLPDQDFSILYEVAAEHQPHGPRDQPHLAQAPGADSA